MIFKAAKGFFQDVYAEPIAWLIRLGWVPQFILLTYYPYYRLHEVAHRSWLVSAKQNSSQDPFLLLQAFLILAPPLNYVLYRYSFLGISKLGGNKVARDGSSQTCTCADKSVECTIHTEAFKLPDTDVRTGLSSNEVSVRRKTYGPNEGWQRRSWVRWVLKDIFDPVVVLVLAGAILALTLGDWWHAASICVLRLLLFSTPAYQQWTADDIASSIFDFDTSWPTIALRDSKLQEVATKDLVPGDIVYVSQWSIVPADGIVVVCDDLLEVNQGSITGDPMSITKNESNRCFWGTWVTRGEAFIQVEHTGPKTFIGRAVSLTQGESGTKGGIAQNFKEFASDGEYLAVVQLFWVIFLVLLVIPVLLWQTSVSLFTSWAEILLLTADMAIVAIKFFSTEAIRTVRAVTAARLSKLGFVIQHSNMKAVEMLAGIDTICVEDSGVITEDRYILVRPCCISCDSETIILAASLSVMQNGSRRALHRAILKALRQFPQAKALRDRYRIVDYQHPDGDTEREYAECLVETPDGARISFASGPSYAILELCQQAAPDGHQKREEVLEQAVQSVRDHGLSSICLAERQEGGYWELLGLLPFWEPPRQCTRLALRQCDELGVRVKVMSSRPEPFVEKIAQAVGLKASMLRADMIDDLELNQSDELMTRLNDVDIYTELDTRHRETILSMLQETGRRVAITGNYTSDVPALRNAKIGITLAGASVSARSASDISFTEKAEGLLSLISSIKLSRQAHQRNQDFIVHRAARTLQIVLAMLFVFLSEGKLLDLRFLLMGQNFLDGVWLWRSSEITDTPCPRKPTRWGREKTLQEVGFIVTVVISGSFLCIYFLPSAEKLQTLSFLLAIGDVWIFALMQPDAYAWFSYQSLKIFGPHLAASLLLNVLCITSWVGESFSISIKAASQVWLYILSTVLVFNARKQLI